MMEQLHNSPSIVAWIVFNEGWGEWDRTETGRITETVKAADPSPDRQRPQRRELLRLQG